jgi:predicted fused transcriptional regulator/phosphomethylpyrimidine kinase
MSRGNGDALDGLEVRMHGDTKNYKFLRISSKERATGTPSNFTVSFGNADILDRCTEVHLMAASIPNIGYNISVALGNNTFTLTHSVDGLITVFFVDGFYSLNQVIARLESEINLQLSVDTITITQNEFTKKLVFSLSGGTASYTADGLNLTLGITAPIAPVASVSAQGLPTLNGSTIFYIHSSDMANNTTYLNSVSGGIIDVNGGFTIPINVPFGVYQDYVANENLDRQVYGRNGKSLKNIRFTIRTNSGRELTELTDNFEVIIVLKLFWHTSD